MMFMIVLGFCIFAIIAFYALAVRPPFYCAQCGSASDTFVCGPCDAVWLEAES